MKSSSWLPSFKASAKLFVAGATVGPIVDSLHNQCLLQYDALAISWSFSEDMPPMFASSWTVPPLLGIAYVVLGGYLPRGLEQALAFLMRRGDKMFTFSKILSVRSQANWSRRTTAVIAVCSTAFIIKLSQVLETHDWLDPDLKVGMLLVAALLQWIVLDSTWVALLAASLTSICGPLSELPFVANHFWHYLPEAGNYFPLERFSENGLLESILGYDYKHLALSSITGPCYFAVTLDAIALGRYFDQEHNVNTESLER